LWKFGEREAFNLKYKDKIEQYFEKHHQSMLEDICTLVQINSEKMEAEEGKPYGRGPYEALQKALEIASKMGFETKNYDNYVGAIDFNHQEKALDILAHLDIVPGGDGWTVTMPFVPLIADGKLYGRGSADDKGPAMAALYAMKAVKDLGIPLTKNIRLILGTDEECGGSDLPHYYAVEEEAPATFSPDGSFPVVNIEKGRLGADFYCSWEEDSGLPRILSIQGGIKSNVVPGLAEAVIEGLSADLAEKIAMEISQATKASFTWKENENLITITAIGENAHASHPEDGNNALTALLELLTRLPFADSAGFDQVKAISTLFPHGDYLGKAAGVAMEDELSGELTLNFGILDYSVKELKGNFDCRAPICATSTNVKEVLQRNMAKMGIELAACDMYPPHYVPEDLPFIQILLDCYEEYTGNKGSCKAIGGGTYVHELERGVAFGSSMPETENHMHGPDEFAVIEELITSAKIFAQVIVELCN